MQPPSISPSARIANPRIAILPSSRAAGAVSQFKRFPSPVIQITETPPRLPGLVRPVPRMCSDLWQECLTGYRNPRHFEGERDTGAVRDDTDMQENPAAAPGINQ